ncbi:MAG TPA: MFS transporter, partial [Caulobacteraceae bacterium]|nr:MFS transporter [Caulobacteraceae bacterium]
TPADFAALSSATVADIGPTSRPWLRRAVGLSAASFAALGGCLTLPGTVLPLLVEHFHIRLVEAGSMLALQPIGYLVTVIGAQYLIGRWGMRAVLSAGPLAFALGYGGFGLASGWISGAAMMLVTGLGFGVTEVALNTLLITIGGERRSNLLNFTHLFFAVGAFVAPPLVAHAVAARVSWRLCFAGAALAMAAVGAGWSRLHVDGIAAPAAGPAGGRRAVRWNLGVLLAAILGVYVGVEMGIGGWLTKYMVSERRTTLTYAGNALSLYWMGLAAGRLMLSALSHRFGETALLLGLTVLSAIALPAGLLAPVPWLAVLCFTITGFGFSGIFPMVIALGGRHHPTDSAAITSVMITGAGIGGIVVPWMMSAIADAAGLTAGMVFYAVMGASMVGLTMLVIRAITDEGLGA